MRGFTSVRDMAGPCSRSSGPSTSGLAPGPRIWPSGAMIIQTGGHGDYRVPTKCRPRAGAPLSHGEAIGRGAIADGEDRVLRRAREQLMLGASQLKLAAGGGVTSAYDPIDVSQYTEAEFRAAVDAAENWGTYVAVHAYTPRAIQTAIAAGVRCVEHGQLMDEASARLMADKDIWLCTAAVPRRRGRDPCPPPRGRQSAKGERGNRRDLSKWRGSRDQDRWGTDILFDAAMAARQGAMLAHARPMVRPGRNPEDGDRGQRRIAGDVGSRNPYPGRLGSWRKARSPICCSSTAIRSPTSD